MLTKEERLQILQMVADGLITAEEAAKLFAEARQPSRIAPARWLHVRVTDLDTAEPKTDVTIPLNIVQMGIKLGARFAGEQNLAAYDEVINAIQQGHSGKVLEAEDADSRQRVEIFLE